MADAETSVLPAAPELATSFNAACGLVHGMLAPLSPEEVAERRQRARQKIEDIVNAALPPDSSPELRQAAFDYGMALSQTRQKINPKQLTEKASGGVNALQDETRQVLEKQTDLDADLRRHLNKEGDVPFLRRIFSFFSRKKKNNTDTNTGNDKSYFLLNDHSFSPIQKMVEEYLSGRGYAVTDYAGGYAADQRKNTIRIGKLLKDAPALLEAFSEDMTRTQERLMVVITGEPTDLARASFDRAWESCRANVWTAAFYAAQEANEGVISAYLVREDDPDIHNPLGRINLKPYHRNKGAGSKQDRVYFAFTPIGLHHPGFVDAVNHYAEEALNGDRYGRFHLPKGCESFMEFEQRWRLPQDAEAAFQLLGIKYHKNEDGKIVVDGDLKLNNLGLNRLPDMRDVIVNGGIDVSYNKLLTLDGLPQARVRWLNVTGNLLTCFTGCPPEAGDRFTYKDNPYLVTTHGAPHAALYVYGNKGNIEESAACTGPLEKPELFPGFKRPKPVKEQPAAPAPS